MPETDQAERAHAWAPRCAREHAGASGTIQDPVAGHRLANTVSVDRHLHGVGFTGGLDAPDARGRPDVHATLAREIEQPGIEFRSEDLPSQPAALEGLDPRVVAAPPRGVASRSIEAGVLDLVQDANLLEQFASAGRNGLGEAVRFAARPLLENDGAVPPLGKEQTGYGAGGTATQDNDRTSQSEENRWPTTVTQKTGERPAALARGGRGIWTVAGWAWPARLGK